MFKKIVILQDGKLIEQIDGVLYHDVYDSKHRKTLVVEAFCQNGQIFRWKRGVSTKRDSTFMSNIKPLSNARKMLHHKIANSNSKFGNGENFSRINNILIDHVRALEINYYQLIRKMFNKRQEIDSGLDLVCLLGTFDPPHLGHVRVLSDAMMQISQTNFKESIGYLVPIGDRAPGPNGKIWKHGLKSTFDFRYRLCSEMVKNFSPIIKTTDIGRKHPTLFGIELCSILAQSASASNLHIVTDVDTWERWEQSFYDCLQHSPILTIRNQIFFWIQPLWKEPVTINGHAKNIQVNILEPKVPYFVHSREIRERNLYSLTAISKTHFLESYT